MPRILSIKKTRFGIFTSKSSRERIKSISPNCSIFNVRECRKIRRNNSGNSRGSINFSPKGVFTLFALIVLAFGFFYLYQVNDLATKGYEIKDIENQVQKLKEDNEKNKIREVELRSMYNIEKVTEDLNLVSPNEITYLNINGPMAMK